MRSRKSSICPQFATGLFCCLLFVLVSVPARAQERILQELFDHEEVLNLYI